MSKDSEKVELAFIGMGLGVCIVLIIVIVVSILMCAGIIG